MSDWQQRRGIFICYGKKCGTLLIFSSQAGTNRAALSEEHLRKAQHCSVELLLCVQPPVPPFTSATAPGSRYQTTPDPDVHIFNRAKCSPATSCPVNASHHQLHAYLLGDHPRLPLLTQTKSQRDAMWGVDRQLSLYPTAAPCCA